MELSNELSEVAEAEGLTRSEIWTSDEVREIPSILPVELTDQVPGMEQAIVCGDPIALGDKLDAQQGFDNPYGAFGTCGLNSIANMVVMSGQELTEPEVVQYAMENDLCNHDDPKFHGGGTTISQQIRILEHYGIQSHCEFAGDAADYERLASAIEGGHGVLLGLNSGVLQDRPWKIYNDDGQVVAGHAVCMTGTVRDCETGELRGFYLCDSSGATPDSGRTFVSLEKMDECYGNVYGGYALITDQPIRGR